MLLLLVCKKYSTRDPSITHASPCKYIMSFDKILHLSQTLRNVFFRFLCEQLITKLCVKERERAIIHVTQKKTSFGPEHEFSVFE